MDKIAPADIGPRGALLLSASALIPQAPQRASFRLQPRGAPCTGTAALTSNAPWYALGRLAPFFGFFFYFSSISSLFSSLLLTKASSINHFSEHFLHYGLHYLRIPSRRTYTHISCNHEQTSIKPHKTPQIGTQN